MISHKHQCIFIHIPKNAGQSIENIFVTDSGLTWKTRAPLLLRKNNDPAQGPSFLAHLTAEEYIKFGYISAEQFQNYFKFAVIRNPFSRAISFYKYFKYQSTLTFNEFVPQVFAKWLWKDEYWFVRPQSEFVSNSAGEILVNDLIKFENLDQDFQKVAKKLNVQQHSLPHVNNSDNKKPRIKFRNWREWLQRRWVALGIKKIPTYNTYHEYYNAESKMFISQLYHRDLELFNYSFD
jgi:hypothetical protein